MKIVRLLFPKATSIIIYTQQPLPNDVLRSGDMIAVWEPIVEFEKRNNIEGIEIKKDS